MVEDTLSTEDTTLIMTRELRLWLRIPCLQKTRHSQNLPHTEMDWSHGSKAEKEKEIFLTGFLNIRKKKLEYKATKTK